MRASVALCAEEQSIRNPELLGLDDENLESQKWLKLFSSGQVMRDFLSSDCSVQEVWIASCEDVAPINLAAALKGDDGSRQVHLITGEELTGSFATRLQAAGLDAPLSQQAFSKRYMQRKGEWQGDGDDGALLFEEGVGAVERAFTVAPEVGLQNDPQRKAFFLPVVSGNGGAGKSTISVVLAYAAQQMGFKTLLVDFDLQFGDIARMAGVLDPPSIDDVLDGSVGVDRLKPQGAVPAVLAAPRRLEDSERVVTAIPQLLAMLSRSFDVVIANTGAFWGEQHALMFEGASRVLFLIDQKPSSMWACHRALDVCARCGIASGQFVFAANRCSKRSMITSVDVSCALKGAYAIEIADGGKDVEELVGAGFPLELFEDGNPLCASAEKALRDLLPCFGDAASKPDSSRRKGWFASKRKNAVGGGLL